MADPISAAVIGAGAAVVVGAATVCVTGVGAAATAGNFAYKVYKDKKEKRHQPQQGQLQWQPQSQPQGQGQIVYIQNYVVYAPPPGSTGVPGMNYGTYSDPQKSYAWKTN